MLNPVRVDAAVDLAYGALILLAIVLIATGEFGVGIVFGIGVFSAYVLHVVWKMARFDPDWMMSVVAETVDESVEQAVEETVAETVDESVETAVDESVNGDIADRLAAVQAQVETVDDRLSRRPREDRVEELIEDSLSGDGRADTEERDG